MNKTYLNKKIEILSNENHDQIETMVLVAGNIIAYPEPNVQWYSPTGKINFTIPNKYEVSQAMKNNLYDFILKIYATKLEDIGVYTLNFGENGNYTFYLNLTGNNLLKTL